MTVMTAVRETGAGRRIRRARGARRVDCCWGSGRRLVVVDVENIAGGPCKTEAAVAWVRQRLAQVGALASDDMVTVAVDECGLAAVAWAWEGARPVYGHGRDGADNALLEVLADRIPQRYGAVVLASGDGIFTEAVSALVAHGVDVTVVAHEISLSNRLRAAASRCVLLSKRSADAA
jgi:hypothetical protein